jgi:hypothetical protein
MKIKERALPCMMLNRAYVYRCAACFGPLAGHSLADGLQARAPVVLEGRPLRRKETRILYPIVVPKGRGCISSLRSTVARTPRILMAPN